MAFICTRKSMVRLMLFGYRLRRDQRLCSAQVISKERLERPACARISLSSISATTIPTPRRPSLWPTLSRGTSPRWTSPPLPLRIERPLLSYKSSNRRDRSPPRRRRGRNWPRRRWRLHPLQWNQQRPSVRRRTRRALVLEVISRLVRC